MHQDIVRKRHRVHSIVMENKAVRAQFMRCWRWNGTVSPVTHFESKSQLCSRNWLGHRMILFLCFNEPLTRYATLLVAHAPGMPGTFSLPTRVSNPIIHHGTCATHLPWCMPGSLSSSFLTLQAEWGTIVADSIFLWSRWWGIRSWHSWRRHTL